MANIRYFADVADRVIRVTNIDHRGGAGLNGGTWGWDPDGKKWIKVTRRIQYKAFPSKHECDARCMGATGKSMNCECSCGGKNHGRQFACN
jgi:hypothetical protein